MTADGVQPHALQTDNPSIQGWGDDTDPTVALYTARAGPDAAAGQMIACTLASGQENICAASPGLLMSVIGSAIRQTRYLVAAGRSERL